VTTVSTTTNAYWEAVRDHLEPDSLAGGALVVDNYGSLGARRSGDYGTRCDRRELTSAYSWTVTSPTTVAFVAEYAGSMVVDPLAGSGWWAHLLTEEGVTVLASDENPPDGTDANKWHRDRTHVPVGTADGAAAVSVAPPGATLLLSWPPMDDAGFRILSAYRGSRVIHIGEGWGGCTGDDDLFELLQRDWIEVAEHMPVQFYGLHDFVTVYDRKEPSR
jgi:hypothetical protein